MPEKVNSLVHCIYFCDYTIPKEGEYQVGGTQSPYHVSRRRNPGPDGNGARLISSVREYSDRFLQMFGKYFGYLLKVTQKMRSKRFPFKCKGSLWTKNSKSTYPDSM